MIQEYHETRTAMSDAAGPGARLPRRIAHFELWTPFSWPWSAPHAPALRGRPVLVGGTGRRAVVASASYEARRYGCHSAQPMAQAMRLCSQAVVVAPRFDRYRAASQAFHEMLRTLSPFVESAGIDEAYVDLTGAGGGGAARAAAEEMRSRVRRELGIAVSACIAGTRSTAKVGSDRAKAGRADRRAGGGRRRLPGAAAAARVAAGRPEAGGAVAGAGHTHRGRGGGAGPPLARAALRASGGVAAPTAPVALTPRRVRSGRRRAKSVSREVTFGDDVLDVATLRRSLRRHAESVGGDLRREGRRARTVTLKLRWSDFSTLVRSRTVDRPLLTTAALVAAGNALLAEVLRREGMRPVRLIGLGASNLVDDAVQLGFDELAAGARGVLRDERLDRALDTIRGRFGKDAVSRGP